MVSSPAVQVQDWGSGAYDRGLVLSESFAWDKIEDMQVELEYCLLQRWI